MIMSKQENFQIDNSHILKLSFSQIREIMKFEAKFEKEIANRGSNRRDIFE